MKDRALTGIGAMGSFQVRNSQDLETEALSQAALLGCGRLEPLILKGVWAVLRRGGGGDVRPPTR